MITLTTPPSINSVLGGNSPISYDKLVVSPITIDPMNSVISGNLQLTSNSNPTMPNINGSFHISGGVVTVTVNQLDFYRRVTLTALQQTQVTNILTNTQATLENGLISLGVINGVQSPGV